MHAVIGRPIKSKRQAYKTIIIIWETKYPVLSFQFTNLNDEGVQELQKKLEYLLNQIRPNAVGIVDGFDIPDIVLNSALGAYDGNVYERLFAEAQKSPLNQEPVNKSFHLYLKPFMKSRL